MAKVYIVTSGSYSDYGIRGVFLSRELADKFAELERLKSYEDNTEVEEWDSDEPIDSRLGYSIYFDPSGEIDDDYINVDDKFVFRDEETGMGAPEVDNSWGGGLRINVNAESRKEAIKIACDKRAEFLAKKHDI